MASSEKNIKIFALGGLGEIGMNCLAIEVSGRILLIDCGAMFSSENLGIDLIHPGFDILAKRREDIEGLVLTHAHEDHIAAVPFLLREMDIPVYGSSYSIALLLEKLKESKLVPKLAAKQLNPGDEQKLETFRVKSFLMPHSIVQNTGLLIETPAGNILHTGDFKLQSTMPKKCEQVLKSLKEISYQGIDLMLSDSTGSEEVDPAGDETIVEETIEEIVRKAAKRVYVAMFSSNAQRLESVFNIAVRNGRKVALCGRSVKTHSRIAAEVQELKIPFGSIVSVEEIAEGPSNDSIVVVSGTQGEPRSALSKLANDSHNILKIEPGDTVILSSRFIPGNELAIGRVIDGLHRKGASVFHRGINSGVHVSGHGSRSEIFRAIKAVSPRCLMPVHGTYRHLVACAELAREAGVKKIAVASDGEVTVCDRESVKTIEMRLPVKRIFIDGAGGLSEGEIRERRVLGSHGVLMVSIAMDKSKKIVGDMEIIARGVVKEELLGWLKKEIEGKVKEAVFSAEKPIQNPLQKYQEIIRSVLRKHLSKKISREPYVIISILSNDESA